MWKEGGLQGVIFDLDDTLINWRQAEAGAMEAVARKHLAPAGVEAAQATSAYASVMEENARNFHATGEWWFVERRLGLLVDRLKVAPGVTGADLAATFMAEVPARLAWLAGASAALDAARQGGRRVGLLTNGFPHVQRPKVDRFGIAQKVDFVGISDELGHWKPKPEAFLAVCARLGTKPERTLMVGDSLMFDISPAKSLGMPTCWVETGGKRHRDADVTVATPGDVAAHF